MNAKNLILLFALSLLATVGEAQQPGNRKLQPVQAEKAPAPAPDAQPKNRKISGSVTPPPANPPLRDARDAQKVQPVNTSTGGIKTTPREGGAQAKLQKVGPAKAPATQKQPK